MGEKLVRWFVFSVLVALLPVAFTYVHVLTDGKQATLAEILAHGELLLISAALAADAVGELIASGREKPLLKLLSGGGCVMTVIFSSLYFADVSSRPSVDSSLVFNISLVVFILTLISSAACKALVQEVE